MKEPLVTINLSEAERTCEVFLGDTGRTDDDPVNLALFSIAVHHLICAMGKRFEMEPLAILRSISRAAKRIGPCEVKAHRIQ